MICKERNENKKKKKKKKDFFFNVSGHYWSIQADSARQLRRKLKLSGTNPAPRHIPAYKTQQGL
ncbi:hypothetical protein QG37_07546 [Candidozyma auris]|uniref:Uncharacterized protein n=1 Tax=Candidozyma auris TaxID=498019 RepID=A0A0L0NQ95_CANAR|nr:hypothetical protein QG37_07546 [[Candida] auris]